MTPGRTSSLTGLHPETIRRRIHRGEIPAWGTYDHRRLEYARAHLAALILLSFVLILIARTVIAPREAYVQGPFGAECGCR